MAKISADDLVFYTDGDKGIYSGGYSVDSILMKSGIPPIMSIRGGGGDGDGSDNGGPFSLFSDLVVPNWAMVGQPARTGGGGVTAKVTAVLDNIDANAADGDSLYEKLLALASDGRDSHTRTHTKSKKEPEPEPEPEPELEPEVEKKPRVRRGRKPTTHKRNRTTSARGEANLSKTHKRRR
jgi:hypothetical protein